MGSKGREPVVYILSNSRSHGGSHVLSHALVYYYLLGRKSRVGQVWLVKRVSGEMGCALY